MLNRHKNRRPPDPTKFFEEPKRRKAKAKPKKCIIPKWAQLPSLAELERLSKPEPPNLFNQ